MATAAPCSRMRCCRRRSRLGITAPALLLVLALLCWSPTPAEAAARRSRQQRRQWLQERLDAQAAERLAMREMCYPIGYTALLRTGESFGGDVAWGALIGADGKPIFEVAPAASPLQGEPLSRFATAVPPPPGFQMPSGYKLVDALSPSPDHPTLHQLNGRNALLSKLGGLPSAWYLADVSVNAAGALRVSGATAVDASGVGGLWLTRSGSVTPWGTHLGGEESPVDCRAYEETFLQQGGSGTGSGGGGGGCVAGRRAAATMCGMAERSPRDGRRLSRFARYFGAYEGAARRHPSLAHLDLFESPEALSAFVSAFKCYNYGASPELRLLANGTAQIVKWRTLGRVSHRGGAVVMEDERTVYTSDDHANGVLLRFVAERPGDLSSGSLFAAKLSAQQQRSDVAKRGAGAAANNPSWSVSWVELGRGTQAELEALARGNLTFSQIFDVARPVTAAAAGPLSSSASSSSSSPPQCPPGFQASATPSRAYLVGDPEGGAAATSPGANPPVFLECLRARPGMETAAAFLETRRYASMRGATAEFDRMDGLTYSRRFKQLYVAVRRVGRGLVEGDARHSAAGDDVRLEPSRCGALFSFDLDDSLSAYRARVMLSGTQEQQQQQQQQQQGAGAGAGAVGDICGASNVADPERTAYIGGSLIIQEGGGGGGGGGVGVGGGGAGSGGSGGARGGGIGQRAVMWAYSVESGQLTRILTAPPGAVLAGVGATRLGPNGYLTFALQRRAGAAGASPPAASSLGNGTADGGGVDEDGDDGDDDDYDDSSEPLSSAASQSDLDARRGVVGYLGPFPSDFLGDEWSLRFDPAALDTAAAASAGSATDDASSPSPSAAAAAAGVVASSRVCATPVLRDPPAVQPSAANIMAAGVGASVASAIAATTVPAATTNRLPSTAQRGGGGVGNNTSSSSSSTSSTSSSSSVPAATAAAAARKMLLP